MGALCVVLVSCTAEMSDDVPDTARVVYQHSMVTLDPHGHNDGVTGAVLSSVYQPLVAIEPGATIRPVLVKEWTTPTDTTWRFQLREGVQFHDGKALTVEDVVASIRRARFAPESSLTTYMEGIAEVRALADDPLGFEITTEAPFPLLLSRLAMVGVVSADFEPAHPVGTGPYRWVSGHEDETIVLRDWPGYWGHKPEVPEVRIDFYGTDEEIDDVVRRGEIDVLGKAGLDFANRVGLSALEGEWRIVRNPAATTTMLGLNGTGGVLADVAVRQAIDLALDRDRLVAEVYDGKGAAPAYSIIPEEVFGARPRRSNGGADLQRARDLLLTSGVAEGSTIKLQHARVTPAVVAHVVDQLSELGFVVEGEDLPYDVFYRRLENADLEAFIFGWNFLFSDASDFLDAMTHTRDPLRKLGDTNGAAYSNPEVDELIEAAAREPVPERRLRQLRSAIAILAEERPYLPLYHAARQAVFRAPFTMTERPGSWLQPHEIRYR
jgi:peptide/nickel transport system substrate-binding protein